MALTIEDGTSKADADSYISLADADEFHTLRGNSSWLEASESEREQALRKAAAYIDSNYRFVGFRETAEQSLAWPRANARDEGGRAVEGVPRKVRDGQAIAAGILLTRELFTVAERGGRIRRVQVGPIVQEFASSASDTTDPQEVTALLREFTHGVGNVKVSRS